MALRRITEVSPHVIVQLWAKAPLSWPRNICLCNRIWGNMKVFSVALLVESRWLKAHTPTRDFQEPKRMRPSSPLLATPRFRFLRWVLWRFFGEIFMWAMITDHHQSRNKLPASQAVTFSWSNLSVKVCRRKMHFLSESVTKVSPPSRRCCGLLPARGSDSKPKQILSNGEKKNN